ncbi:MULTISPECIES: relaxase/mobilization nuclease domain-containing protein [unclassified Desulfovibrio]|uniref:relaxase/mobilization nuclease domain-containing protein n=1 Tax=unclassified Desulfovibrio TaxID=2593640 RepID=UPI002FDA4415
MIAKLVKGKGFRGALEYDLREQKGHILDTNMGGDNPRELAREFGAVRALRPNLTKAVCHVSISLPPDEKLTDDQWKDVAGKYLEGMGFKDSQYVVTKHTDTEHPHIHILANRVSMSGEVVSDSRDYQRQEAIMRRLEREYGLKEVTPSRESERRAPTKGEIECAVRTGKPSAKMALQTLVDKALHNQPGYAEFTRRLEKSGVEVLPNVASTGRISGISYRHSGIIMKGSDLGKGYSWAGLQKRGLTYEQDRSPAPDDRGRYAEAVERGSPTAGRDSHAESPERRGIGEITRTLAERHAQNNLGHGASLGSSGPEFPIHQKPTRGDNKNMELLPFQDRGTGRQDSEHAITDGQRSAGDKSPHGGDGKTGKPSLTNEDVGALGVSSGGGSAAVSALDRIRALADAGLRYSVPEPVQNLQNAGKRGGENSGSGREEMMEIEKARKREVDMER